MVWKNRRSRILLEELGRRSLKHHTDVEVKVTYRLRDVGSGVDCNHEVNAILPADRVNKILIPRKPIFSRIPSVDNLIKEYSLNQVSIPMLSSIKLLKDVLLSELSCIGNTSVILGIGINGGAVLSLDVEQDPLGASTKSQLTLLLEVYLLGLPVSAIAVKDDVSKVVPELESLGPLGELTRLPILVVVRPVIGHWRVVPSAVLKRVGLTKSILDICLLAISLSGLSLGEVVAKLRGYGILPSRPSFSRWPSGSGRALRPRGTGRTSLSDCAVRTLSSISTSISLGSGRARNTLITLGSWRASRTPRSLRPWNRGTSSTTASRSRRTLRAGRSSGSRPTVFTLRSGRALRAGRSSGSRLTVFTLRSGRTNGASGTDWAWRSSATTASAAKGKRRNLGSGVDGNDVDSLTLR